MICLIQRFGVDFLSGNSQPQNPEFGNDPENIHSCIPASLRLISYCGLDGVKYLLSFLAWIQKVFSDGVQFFFLSVNKWIQIPQKSGHDRHASETPFKWRFAGVLMMAQH